ncbi:MAG: hypothetical protein WCG82_10495, partial [Bacteroidota bacterium]
MKKIITVSAIILFTITVSSYGQLAVGYNTDGNTLCLSTNPLHKFWSEFRVNTNSYNQASWSYNDRGITQVYMMVKIFTANNVNLYSGGGLGMNLLSNDEEKWVSVNVPVGLRINPFTALPDLYLVGEYNPMIIAV